MSNYVDFTALKEAVTIEQVAQLLDLELKQTNGQLRGPCPTCNSGGDRALVITPSKGLYYCFAEKKGGDMIALAGHIEGLAMKDAAQFINDTLTVPEEKVAKETSSNKKLQPLTLEHDHELVTAIGLDPTAAEALGIGYCSKGIMKGIVAFPLRDEDGVLQHYVGVDSPVTLPKALQYQGENVVKFEKKSAR